jgi:hypothetical protein
VRHLTFNIRTSSILKHETFLRGTQSERLYEEATEGLIALTCGKKEGDGGSVDGLGSGFAVSVGRDGGFQKENILSHKRKSSPKLGHIEKSERKKDDREEAHRNS